MTKSRRRTDLDMNWDFDYFIEESENLIAGIPPLYFTHDTKLQMVRVIGSDRTVVITDKASDDIYEVVKMVACPLCYGNLFPIIEIDSDDPILMKCARCRNIFSVDIQLPYVLRKS